MAAVRISLQEMDEFLKRNFRALKPKKSIVRGEIVYDLDLSDNVVIRVWTSMGGTTGYSAEEGTDAIRVVLLSKHQQPLAAKSPIVKRVESWRANLRDRINDFISEYDADEERLETKAKEPPAARSGPAMATDKQVQYALFLAKKNTSRALYVLDNVLRLGDRIDSGDLERVFKGLTIRQMGTLIDNLK